MTGFNVVSLIRRALFLVAALPAALCLCACGPKAINAIAQPQQDTLALDTPGPTLAPGTTPLDRLCAYSWVDVYDSSFILTFDKLGNRMIESNDPAGIKHTYRIAVEEDTILVYDDLGLTISRLPYTLSDDSLSIDYGDDLGFLEYRPLR